MSDLISRKAAIDALNNYFAKWAEYACWSKTVKNMVEVAQDSVKEMLTDLPSAQPEHATCYLDSPCEYQNINIALPSAQPERKTGRWIPCSERLPEVSYDYLGNWSSPEVILLMNDEEYIRVCNGHFNPVGIFEVYENDGPLWVGEPVKHVLAWMPLPEPYKEDANETTR